MTQVQESFLDAINTFLDEKDSPPKEEEVKEDVEVYNYLEHWNTLPANRADQELPHEIANPTFSELFGFDDYSLLCCLSRDDIRRLVYDAANGDSNEVETLTLLIAELLDFVWDMKKAY